MGPGGPMGSLKGGNEDVIMHNISSTTAYQPGTSGGGGMSIVNDQVAALPAFQRAIYEAIVANRGANEGVHVATIARALQNPNGVKANAKEVSCVHRSCFFLSRSDSHLQRCTGSTYG
jgi:hypothetical protein